MNKVKKLCFIICFAIFAILFSNVTVKAATDISNLTSAQLYQWMKAGSPEFFQMDPIDLVNRYGNVESGTYVKGTDGWRSPVDNESYIYCINQYSNGTWPHDGYYITGVVDVDINGNVTVYTKNGKVQVTDSTAIRKFRSYATLMIDLYRNWTRTKAYAIESFFHANLSVFRQYVNVDFSSELSSSDASYVNSLYDKGVYPGVSDSRGISLRMLFISMGYQRGQARVAWTWNWGDLFPAKTGTLKITKKDQDKKTNLAGAAFSVTASDGSVHTGTTGSNGQVIIKDIPAGKCTVKETKAPTNYNASGNQSVTITAGKQSTLTFNDKYKFGNLEIVKKDKDTGKLLSGAEFTATAKSDSKQYKITSNSKGEYKKDLPIGTYTVKETKAPTGYNLSGTTKTVTIDSWGNVKIEYENQIKKGTINLSKVDADTGVGLANVEFTLQMTSGYYNEYEKYVGKYVGINQNGEATYNDKLTTIKTDQNGKAKITQLWPGTYKLIEVNIPYNGYEKMPKTIESAMKIDPGDTKNINAKNKRMYVDLSGYVWEDLPYQKGKEQESNYLYNEGNYDVNDKLLKDIKVELVDSKGTVIATTTTNAQGKYQFTNVDIDKLADYHIEFEYNGMSYESVVLNKDKANGNKASEGTNRTTFNEQYNSISHLQSNNSKREKTYDIKYENVENFKSNLLYGEKANYNYGYSGDNSLRDPVSGVDEQYLIRATTQNAYNGGLDKIKSADEIRKQGIEEITDINLGIITREKVDLSIVKDLQSVSVNINGLQHIYNYADRFDTTLYYDEQGRNGYDMEPAVKFGEKYGNMSYTRALYASDVHYTGDDGLEVKATYKIGIRNTSTNLKAVINEITDYYDSKYEFVAAGTMIDEYGNITENTKITGDNNIIFENSGVSTYQKVRIKTNVEATNQEGFIYIQLRVIPKNIIDILGITDDEVKLDNVSEISSYSIKDKNNNAYAAIDRDSQPGNVDIAKYEETKNKSQSGFEDDTDQAPGLKLVLQEERKVGGKIFVDSTETEEGQDANGLMKGQVRQGNGKYDEGELGLAGVEVTLMDVDTNQMAEVWNDDTNDWVEAVYTTGEQGEYEIGGFIPGNYEIVYKWGDKTYKVQDYKSTIVDYDSYNEKGEGKDLEWYKDEFKQKYPNVEWDENKNSEIRATDGVDDYEQREKIDEQTSQLTNANKQVIENYEGEIELKDGTKEKLITKMESKTPVFRVNVEYDTTPTNPRDEYETNEDGTVKMENGYAVKKEGKKNYLRSVDFGIVERAKQALDLTKTIKSARITLPNGNVLINVEVENGKIKEPVNGAMYLPKSEASEAQLKLEVDGELIDGSQLEVEHEIKIENISEVDYKNKDFYLYGKNHGENGEDLVRLSAQNVIDYLNNNINTKAEEEGLGEIIQEVNSKQDLINKGLLVDSTDMKQLLNKTTKILLINDKLSEELTPLVTETTKTEVSVPLVQSKLLSNTSQESLFIENSAEIIKVEKTAGSTLESMPGNYIPKVTESEYDDGDAENLAILQPTGQNLNYVPIILLSISTLGILAVGIILIKKKLTK